MLGEVEPLKALHDASTRDHVVERILKEFPERTLSPSQRILRLRRNPNPPTPRSTTHHLLDSAATVASTRRTFRSCTHRRMSRCAFTSAGSPWRTTYTWPR
jgi:hypothetical protein